MPPRFTARVLDALQVPELATAMPDHPELSWPVPPSVLAQSNERVPALLRWFLSTDVSFVI